MALPKPQLNGDVLAYDENQTDEINAQTITSGSNSNGSWTKFPDGTMIQRTTLTTSTTGSIDYRGTANWTFPLPFVGSPNVLVTLSAGDGGFGDTDYIERVVNIGHLSVTVWIYRFQSASKDFTATTLGGIQVVAFGRWK